VNAARYFTLRYWAHRYFAIRPYISVVHEAVWPFVAESRLYEFEKQRSYLFVASQYQEAERTEIVFVADQKIDFATSCPWIELVADSRMYVHSAGQRKFLFYAAPLEESENLGRTFAALRSFDHADSARIGTI